MVKNVVKKVVTRAKSTAKNTGKVLKGVGKVAGASYVAEGAQDVVNGLKTGKLVKAAKGVVKTAAGVALLKNHTDWYTKGDLSLLGAPNVQQQDGRPLAVNTIKAFNPVHISIPNHLSFVGRLTIPDTDPVVVNAQVSEFSEAIPSYGWTQGIQQLQNTLRAVNTSARTYTPGDVESYVLQDRSVIAGLGMALRALKWVSNYDRTDISIPAVHIKMMGFDKEDLINNKQSYASRLMQLIHKHAKIVPLNLDIFDRTWWLTTNIFRDDDKKSKDDDFLYTLPTLDGFVNTGDRYALTARTVAGNPGFCAIPDFTEDVWSEYPRLSILLDTINEFMNVFVEYAQFADISADIWKAYGAAAQFKYYTAAVNELEKIFTGVLVPETVYDRAICDQFMNADLCDGVNDNTAYAKATFEQNDATFAGPSYNPYLKTGINTMATVKTAGLQLRVNAFQQDFNPYSSAVNKANTYGIITIPDEAKEPGQFLSLSRFKCKVHIQEGSISTPRKITRRYCGTEIVCYVAPIAVVDATPKTPIFGFDYSLQDNMIATCIAGCNIYYYNNLSTTIPNTSQLSYGIASIAQSEISSFPRVCFQPDLNGDDSDEGVPLGLCGRFDVWAAFPNTLCESYHSVCAFSLLYVDQRIRPLNNVIVV